MGYRSEVCIAMTDDATRLFRTILDHLPSSHEVHDLVVHADSHSHHLIKKDQHKDPATDCDSRMYWDSVKWYDGYDCVGFIEEFMESIPEEDYRFVRIGEESDDVQEAGDYWESDVHIQRSISW